MTAQHADNPGCPPPTVPGQDEPQASPLAGRWALPAARGAGWARRRASTALGAVALFAAVAAAHAAGTAVVYQFSHLTSAGEVFFPAAGVTVAVLLLVPRRWWPVVLAAAFSAELAAHVILGEAAGTAIGAALASTAEPALGAVLVLRALGGRPQLSRRRDLTTFVLCAAVAAPALGALIGAVATRFTYPHGPFLTVFARWWTGGALGVLIVGSLLLAWLTREASPVWARHCLFEGGLLAVITCLVCWLAFWRWPPELAYLALVPLGWAAIRFGTRGATAAGAVIAVLAEWATAAGHGLFAAVSHTHDRALWFLQLFLAVVFLGGLMMAAAVAEVSRAEAALRASEAAERDARLAASDAHATERNRLARELHDSVSQGLFSMTMHAGAAQLALARAGLAESSPAARAIARLRTLTAGALAEMRALIFELRPGALAEEGLVSALRRQGAAISAREEVQITIDGPDSRLNLAPAAEEHAYRVVLEAWHNTVKHAGAAAITTTVTADAAAVTVQVNDDGCGFDPASVPPGHLGLQTMRERAAAIGATFHLASAPGKGTTITFRVPGRQPLPGPATAPAAALAAGGPLA
jgi:signal transduction histidine kinase